ncbi:aspartic proteinase Asp1-like [Vicia villosa]|uniref:aspartic proteinase Asp1-like n=1 Tax=Vicia villosa TaxID=3911 RepID=UPI00273A8682|nr:aspartic proteinase Asp1-like [Vicia villosa]
MRGVSLITFSLFSLLFTIFSHHLSAAEQFIHKNQTNPQIIDAFDSSFVYPLKGNVYPRGNFIASINIGNPSKPYELDIDTGSDFTWIQCDAPCTHCTVPKEKQYKPHDNYVKYSDQLCSLIPPIPGTHPKPNDQCKYRIQYEDKSTSDGALVRDSIHIGTTKTPATQPSLAFGCGYDQKFRPDTPPSVGVLGLGNGKISISSQLNSLGLSQRVLGHCLSSKEGGYLFFGDKFIPRSGVVWTPIINGPHYIVGPADLLFDGKPTSVKGLQLLFDSGTTYTHLPSQIYNAVLSQVSANLKGKPLSRSVEDPELPVCWESNLKPHKLFKSLNEVKGFFKPLTLIFTKSKNLQFQIPPENYLIISKYGSVCFGILDGQQMNVNLIGDIFMQDKLVIYDNEKQQVGWTSANCNQVPH